MQRIYVGQIGLKIIVETNAVQNGIDLTGATAELVVKKPDGSIMNLPATIENESEFVYTTVTGDELDVFGRYYLQSKITTQDFSALGTTAEVFVSSQFN